MRLALRLSVALAIVLALSPAFAQNSRPSITPVKSTPDMIVQQGVTLDVIFPAFVEYIAIKNECASDLYFDLGGYDFSETSPTTPDAYSLRLASGEAFSGFWHTRSIGVSPASGNTTACTFTLVVGR
jgi:hypothetical protein